MTAVTVRVGKAQIQQHNLVFALAELLESRAQRPHVLQCDAVLAGVPQAFLQQASVTRIVFDEKNAYSVNVHVRGLNSLELHRSENSKRLFRAIYKGFYHSQARDSGFF